MPLKRTLLRARRSAFVAVAAVPAVLLSTVAVTPARASVPSAAPVAPATSALQQDVDALHATGSTSVLAEVVDHGQSTTARAGVARLGRDRPVPFDARYRTGSVTKTMVSTVVLQLVGEGRLSLDDTVDRWLPGVIQGNGHDGRNITVRQLLNHTSGIFDYTSDEPFLEQLLLTLEGFEANRFNRYEPQDLIDVALSHEPTFAPGEGFSYSNTNYIVVGEIIEAVTGNSWDQELKRRIIRPLDLRHTTVPRNNPSIPGPNAHSYNIFTTDPADRVYTDTTLHNPSWAGAAGAVLTTTADQNRFLSALLSGELLAPAQLAEMQDTVELAPGFGYGLGIFHQAFTCDNGTDAEFWGHDGGTVGYRTYALATPDGERSVVLSLATTTFSDVQYFDDSGNAASDLLVNVFCGATTNRTAAAPEQRTDSSDAVLAGLQWTRSVM